jgi:hypothetical protein
MYEFVVSYIACCLPVFRACDHALTEIFQLELFGPVITHFHERRVSIHQTEILDSEVAERNKMCGICRKCALFMRTFS